MSQDQAFEDLREIADPEDRWWFTAQGLLLLTGLAQLAAGHPVRALPPNALRVTGPEVRYWLAVYRGLRQAFRS